MRPAPRIQSSKLAIAIGLAAFFALMLWLHVAGYSSSAESMRVELLAKSFWQSPFWVWLKHDFALPGEIVHHDFASRPLYALLLKAMDALGVTNSHRSSWLSAGLFAACLPTLAWSLQGPSKSSKKDFNADGDRSGDALLTALISWLLLVALGQAHLLTEISEGGELPALILANVASLGFLRRGQFLAAGVAGSLAYLTRSGGEILCGSLIISFIALSIAANQWDWLPNTKKLKSVSRTKELAAKLCMLIIPMLFLAGPWIARSQFMAPEGNSAFMSELAPVFMEGEGNRYRWFPSTDSAFDGSHPRWANYVGFEMYVRNRWEEWVTPYVGTYFKELALSGLVLFLMLLFAIKRPGHRALMALLGTQAFLSIAAGSGWAGTMDRKMLLPLDVLATSWIALMIMDKSKALKSVGLCLVGLIVIGNLPALQAELSGPAVAAPRINEERVQQAQALVATNPQGEPTLCAAHEGEILAYLTSRIPIVNLPTNYKDAGIMDQFLDRWKIRWTTVGDQIRPFTQKHALKQLQAPNGAYLWEVSKP